MDNIEGFMSGIIQVDVITDHTVNERWEYPPEKKMESTFRKYSDI